MNEPTIQIEPCFPLNDPGIPLFYLRVVNWARGLNTIIDGGVSAKFCRIVGDCPCASIFWNGEIVVWLYPVDNDTVSSSLYRMLTGESGFKFAPKNAWKEVFRPRLLGMLSIKMLAIGKKINDVESTPENFLMLFNNT